MLRVVQLGFPAESVAGGLGVVWVQFAFFTCIHVDWFWNRQSQTCFGTLNLSSMTHSQKVKRPQTVGRKIKIESKSSFSVSQLPTFTSTSRANNNFQYMLPRMNFCLGCRERSIGRVYMTAPVGDTCC